jgi:CRP-like cAMP-binding protein
MAIAAVTGADLGKLLPLEALRPQTRDQLAAAAVVTGHRRDEIVFRAGDLDDDSSLFLLEGELRCAYADGRVVALVAGSRPARHALDEALPRRFTASVSSDSAQVLRLERRFVEKLTTWDQLSRDPTWRFQDDGADGHRWIYRLLRSHALMRLPAGNLEQMFRQFERIEVAAGEVVISEGDAPDRFYVIGAGTASVARMLDGAPEVVACLREGDMFGEDGLLAKAPRNATVRMLEAGYLMALSQEAFNTVLKPPLVSWVLPEQAAQLVQEGARLVDVRMPGEYGRRAIRGAANVPLGQLREEMPGLLGTGSHVLVYCNTGERSAAAAFILTSMGYRVDALQGGLGAMLRLQAPPGASA